MRTNPSPASLNALQQLAGIPAGDISTGVVPATKAPPLEPGEAASPIADPDVSTGSLIRSPRPLWKGGY